MGYMEGASPAHERREGRNRLSVRDPRLESMLAGISLEGFNIEEARSWGNALLRARDSWADVCRRGRRYSDREEPRFQNNLARPGRREA